MRAWPFFKYSPSGNMTLLMPDMTLGASERAALACRLMQHDHVGAEQVGYVDTLSDPPRLEMMGGELCVNACRAMAALLHTENRLPFSTAPDGAAPFGEHAGWSYGYLRSSGVDEPVLLRARAIQTTETPNAVPVSHEAGVRLRLKPAPDIAPVADGIHLVRLPGIAHLILDVARHPVPKNWREASAVLRRRFSLEADEAVGCLWLDAGVPSIVPVVWVRATNAAVLETACGSGTLACALYLADRHPDYGHSDTIQIQQYGGDILDVSLHRTRSGPGSPQFLWVWISGVVDCVARGECYVPSRGY